MAPLISIAIPTRERGRYLTHCLETALRCDPRKVEIVVSDNASADTSFITDHRFSTVKFVKNNTRMPVAANFEAAFAACSGSYIIYLGDDDAVIPSGISDLIELLEERRPDIVSWPEPHYYWPNGEKHGSLTIKRRQLRGGVAEQDPREVMAAVWAGNWGNNTIHCGCVSRRIVDQIRAQCGRYFYYLNPDASAYGAIALAKSYLYLNRPVTMYGRSPASNTTAWASPNSEVHKAWLTENAAELKPDSLGMESRSLAAGALEGLLTAVRLLGLTEPPVNLIRWKARISADIVRMPESERPRQLALVNDWLARLNQDRIQLSQSGVPEDAKRKRRLSLGKITIDVTPSFLGDIATAVDAVELLIGPGRLTRREGGYAAWTRWIRLASRATLMNLRAMRADGKTRAR